MEFSMKAVLKYYGPLITSCLFVGLFFITSQAGVTTNLKFGVFGLDIFEISTPIANAVIWKSVYIGAILISLSSYMFIDFTEFFPTRFSMEVFFDGRGINMALNKLFKEKELRELSVPIDYEHYRQEYYASVDKALIENLNRKGFFTVKEGKPHSTGSITFFVQKIRGVHRYHISESSGNLKHVIEVANSGQSEFLSFVEKIDSEYDFVSLAPSDLLKGRVILMPQFKQILAEHYTSDKIVFHHVLHGVTKIYLFPLPIYSWTIYFYKHEAGLIPIGYAIYD